MEHSVTVLERTLACLDGLREILETVSPQEVDKVIEALLQAQRDDRKVYIAAAGRANLIMRTFAMRLMHIGFRSYVVFDTNTPAIEPGDLLLIGSGSGSTETVQIIARQAIEKGAHLILFTKASDSPIANMAELILRIPTCRRTQKLQTKGSEFEQSLFILCDNIGMELMLRLGCIQSPEEVDSFIRIRHANLQ